MPTLRSPERPALRGSRRSNRNDSSQSPSRTNDSGGVDRGAGNVQASGTNKNKVDLKTSKKVRDQLSATPGAENGKGKIPACEPGTQHKHQEHGGVPGSQSQDRQGISLRAACEEVQAGKSKGIKSQGKEVGKLDNDVFKPFGPPSRSSSVGDVIDCTICTGGGPSKPCGRQVSDEDEGVLCDACCLWFHANCQGLSETEMKALKRHKSLAWLCSGCKEGFSKTAHRCGCCTRLETRLCHLEEALRAGKNAVESM